MMGVVWSNTLFATTLHKITPFFYVSRQDGFFSPSIYLLSALKTPLRYVGLLSLKNHLYFWRWRSVWFVMYNSGLFSLPRSLLVFRLPVARKAVSSALKGYFFLMSLNTISKHVPTSTSTLAKYSPNTESDGAWMALIMSGTTMAAMIIKSAMI